MSEPRWSWTEPRLLLPWVVAAVVLFGVLRALNFGPGFWALGGTTLLVGLSVSTYQVHFREPGQRWVVDDAHIAAEASTDRTVAFYQRVVESAVSATTPSPHLHRLLSHAADTRLRQRLGEHPAPEAVRAALGPDLDDFLHGPPRRLTLTEIDRFLTRIEAL